MNSQLSPIFENVPFFLQRIESKLYSFSFIFGLYLLILNFPVVEEAVDVTTEALIPDEEEDRTLISETLYEDEPAVFPTPSLRRLLPDKARKIEEANRIHVLPEYFKTDIDPQAIPKINHTPQQKYIEILGDLVGCKEYKRSLAEFWFLDTLANLLRKAQIDKMERREFLCCLYSVGQSR